MADPVALYNMEYARSGAPQPINRVGISHVGPTLLSQGTVQQQQRWMPAILDASELAAEGFRLGEFKFASLCFCETDCLRAGHAACAASAAA